MLDVGFRDELEEWVDELEVVDVLVDEAEELELLDELDEELEDELELEVKDTLEDELEDVDPASVQEPSEE